MLRKLDKYATWFVVIVLVGVFVLWSYSLLTIPPDYNLSSDYVPDPYATVEYRSRLSPALIYSSLVH